MDNVAFMTAIISQTTKQIGDAGEEIAVRYLTEQGLKVLARNFRVKGGEIDVVCREDATTVFVEVRKRASIRFGGAAYSITPTKQQRLILAARHWLVRHGDADCRFDCVLIDGDTLEWVKNAFAAD
jgi:putative endonuclease